MNTLSYKLTILEHGSNASTIEKIAQEAAEILPGASWIEGTPNILIAEYDKSAINIAVQLAGGLDWEVQVVDRLPGLDKPERIKSFFFDIGLIYVLLYLFPATIDPKGDMYGLIRCTLGLNFSLTA